MLQTSVIICDLEDIHSDSRKSIVTNICCHGDTH